MVLQSLKHAGWPALIACAAAAACSKTPASEDAYINAVVQAGDNGALCAFSGSSNSVLLIGSANAGGPSTVPDGTGLVAIECTVSANGGGYDIQLGVSGNGGGKVTISGHVDPKTGGTVRGTFASDALGVFAEDDCALTYTYANNAIPSGQNISAGQIFGHVDCKTAAMPGNLNQVTTSDGGSSPVTCEASADFLFQNCSE